MESELNDNIIIEDDFEIKVKNKIGRPKKVRPEITIEERGLLPFMNINKNKDSKQRFICSLCNESYIAKRNCLRHLNYTHHDEITTIITGSVINFHIPKIRILWISVSLEYKD